MEQWNATRIWERLDRAVANDAWKFLFPNVEVTHGVAVSSDHLPLLVDTSPEAETIPKKRIFRFEPFWVQEKECNDIVKNSWNMEKRVDITTFLDLLEEMKGKLQAWQRSIFINIPNQIKKA